MKNLNFETILKDAEKFTLTENDSYIKTYPEFLKYFENIEVGEINEHHLVIASHFVYGWMPTIIQLKLEKKDEVLKLLNAVKSGHILLTRRLLKRIEFQFFNIKINNLKFLYSCLITVGLINEKDLEILKTAINNSLVGLSKLLHFINPKDYAIWDSRIFRYLTEKKSDYGIGNPKLYVEYLNGLKSISKHKNYHKLHEIIARNFEYEIYPMRAIEITMFETNRKNQNRIKNKFNAQTTKALEKITVGNKT